MDKKHLIELLIRKLQDELDAVIRSARAAHEAATDPEAKPENQYDTRGLEASYLAGAQALRVAELQAQISAYRMMPVQEFVEGQPVGPGALVELESEEGGQRSRYLIVPRGGGVSVSAEGKSVLALAPHSPMGEALIGRKSGDEIEVEARGAVREYRIVRVN